jgi:hypothetical protein
MSHVTEFFLGHNCNIKKQGFISADMQPALLFPGILLHWKSATFLEEKWYVTITSREKK